MVEVHLQLHQTAPRQFDDSANLLRAVWRVTGASSSVPRGEAPRGRNPAVRSERSKRQVCLYEGHAICQSMEAPQVRGSPSPAHDTRLYKPSSPCKVHHMDPRLVGNAGHT